MNRWITKKNVPFNEYDKELEALLEPVTNYLAENKGKFEGLQVKIEINTPVIEMGPEYDVITD
jgi:hypothetical protein